MAQFPFAHNLEMTYRLMDGALQVEIAVENLSSDLLPLSLGFHTYYRIDDSARDDCRIHVPARSQVLVSDALIPTGEMRPATLSDPQPLRGYPLDTGFTDLVRDAAGRAEFWVQGKQQKIRIVFGAKYNVAVKGAERGQRRFYVRARSPHHRGTRRNPASEPDMNNHTSAIQRRMIGRHF